MKTVRNECGYVTVSSVRWLIMVIRWTENLRLRWTHNGKWKVLLLISSSSFVIYHKFFIVIPFSKFKFFVKQKPTKNVSFFILLIHHHHQNRIKVIKFGLNMLTILVHHKNRIEFSFEWDFIWLIHFIWFELWDNEIKNYTQITNWIKLDFLKD